MGGPPAVPEVVNPLALPSSHAPVPASQQSVNASLFRSAADEKTAVGDFAAAITLYEQAIKLTPDDAELLLCRAMACRLSNPPQFQSALRDANAAIEVNPTSWYAWHTKGELMGCLDDFDGAEEAFREAYASATGMDKIKVQTSLGEIRRKRDMATTFASQVQTPSQPQASNTFNTTYQHQIFQTNTGDQPTSHSELPSPSSPSPSYMTPPADSTWSTPAPNNPLHPSPPPPAQAERSPSPYVPTPVSHFTTPAPNQQQNLTSQYSQSLLSSPALPSSQPHIPSTPFQTTPASQKVTATATTVTPTTQGTSPTAPASPQQSSSNAPPSNLTTSSPSQTQATAPSLVRPPPSPRATESTNATITTRKSCQQKNGIRG